MKKKISISIVVATFVLVAVDQLFGNSFVVPTFENVKESHIPSDLKLLDRNGEALDSLRTNSKVRKLSWLAYENVPNFFFETLIHIEDRRFYQHHGVDWLASINALVHQPFYKRGASTISMQVVSFLDPKLKKQTRNKNFSQKLIQMKDAIQLENTWTKKQILEAYVNLSYFRGELQGLRAASEGSFQKQPMGLSMEESLILAAAIQKPTGDIRHLSERACRIAIETKVSQNCDSLETLISEKFSKPYAISKNESFAPQVARTLLKNQKQDVRSTLDKNLQIFSVETVRRQLDLLRDKNVNDAAVLVLDNQTGEVLSYVANSGDDRVFYVDGVQAKRQAGSTLKPFLYATAFEKRILTPVSILKDEPLEIAVSSGVYRPRNYDEVFHGKVTAKVALGSSMNVPAVKTLQLIGVDSFLEKLKLLGFTKLKEDKFYGPSLALGSADVSLWELTNAYRTLANQGVRSDPKLQLSDAPSESTQVFSSDVSFLIADILSDANNRSLTFGLGSALSGRTWFAVKTGTSKDMRDNWCVGFSNRYTVGVWVGNFSGEPMWDVSGVTGAAPIFHEIIHWLHRDVQSVHPEPTNGVVKNSRGIWFLAGTESKKDFTSPTIVIPKIIYPSTETVFAWDPDIPEDLQKIMFEAKQYDSKWLWKLNDSILGKADRALDWRPNKNGNFSLALVDSNKRILDEVTFEVRGVSAQKH